jgi:hypothetical protein
MGKLFLVGQNINYETGLWDFSGVFDNKELAINACRNENYWVAEIELNQQLSHERVDFKFAFYPKRNI